MLRDRRFLILTSDSGFGHRSAANSIAKALKLQHPQGMAVTVVNPAFEKLASPILKRTELNYDRTVKNNSNFYRFTYEISDSRPASALVENTLILALYSNMKQIIADVRPDVVLNTNQLYNAPAGAVLRLMRHRPQFYTVVTDLADVHAMWFNSLPDRFFVASEWVRSKAIASGIPSEKIHISGIPVDPGFGLSQADQFETRLSLGLDPRLMTLLVVGSRRVSGIIDHLYALEKFEYPFQVVVIAGGDTDLYEQANRHDWSFPIHIKNYVTNMPEWMSSADILITKAGGLILSEGLTAGLPIIMIDRLPGQEEGNVRFILNNQAGAIVENPEEFSWLLNLWLKEPQRQLKTIAMNSRRLGHPGAAFEIADALWQAAEKKASQPASLLHTWKNL